MSSPAAPPAHRRHALWTTDELVLLRELARDFARREVAPCRERWEAQHHVDRELWTRAGEVGLLCAGIPVEYGGAGGDLRHDAVIAEEQVRAAGRGWNVSLHSALCAHYLLAYGTEQQKRRWLPRMASGELVCAIAMTEPGTGSDLKAIKTRAVRDGDAYVLSGAKTFISNGLLADLVIVVAMTDPSAGARGISLLVAEVDGLEGFERGRVLDKIGQHAQDTTELFFDGARVPTANLLGDSEGQGFGQLMAQLPRERLVLALEAVAEIERAVELTAEYVKQRIVFGRPLIDFQNTRFVLAECKTEAAVARVFVDDCLERHFAGELDTTTTAMAKWWVTEIQCRVVDRCLQLFGGYGYMREYPIARMYEDARIQKIYGGTNEIMKELIARSL